HAVSDRQDTEHVHHAATIHVHHDLEKPQLLPRAPRRQRFVVGKPTVASGGRDAREPPVVFGNEVAEPVTHCHHPRPILPHTSSRRSIARSPQPKNSCHRRLRETPAIRPYCISFDAVIGYSERFADSPCGRWPIRLHW